MAQVATVRTSACGACLLALVVNAKVLTPYAPMSGAQGRLVPV